MMTDDPSTVDVIIYHNPQCGTEDGEPVIDAKGNRVRKATQRAGQ